MSSASKRNTAAATATEQVAVAQLAHKKIARLAYSYWEARGCPEGSSQEDWLRAEEELRRRKTAWAALKDKPRRGRVARTSSRTTRTVAAA
jgi:hypothetical protein